MDSCSVNFKPSIEKDLRGLPKSLISRVMSRIEKLRDDPFPRQTVRLSGAERLYRVRVGEYRIIYEVDTQAKEITYDTGVKFTARCEDSLFLKFQQTAVKSDYRKKPPLNQCYPRSIPPDR